jgi:hypothetical protein
MAMVRRMAIRRGELRRRFSRLNRDGPGDVCTKTPGGDACVDNFNPLPWLIIGLVLLIAGFVWFVQRRRVAASA